MNSKKKLLKRLILRDTNEKGFDVSRFTISLRQWHTTVTSTEGEIGGKKHKIGGEKL